MLQEHQCLYGAAGKAKESLERLCDHLSIDSAEDCAQTHVFTEAVPREPMVTNGPSQSLNASSIPDQPIEITSQINWGLSDLDLEAIAQGFRFDGELDYLMHPVGM